MGGAEKRRKTSAIGQAWRSENVGLPCGVALQAAAAVLSVHIRGVATLEKLQWWANVLFPGASHEPHAHVGQWSFVHHLTDGAPLIFVGEMKQYPARAEGFSFFRLK